MEQPSSVTDFVLPSPVHDYTQPFTLVMKNPGQAKKLKFTELPSVTQFYILWMYLHITAKHHTLKLQHDIVVLYM